MANKQLQILSSRSRSPILLFRIYPFAFSLLLSLSLPFTLSIPEHYPQSLSQTRNLLHRCPQALQILLLSVSYSQRRRCAKIRRSSVSKERDRFYREPSYPLNLPIRVYLYEMPAKFTHNLPWLFRSTSRDADNLTSNGSPVHRLIELVSLHFVTIIIKVILYIFVELIIVSVIVTCVQRSAD